MIRHDTIQEFVSYVNRTNLSLTSTIKPDFYESNTFLIENEPSLIEYAFFSWINLNYLIFTKQSYKKMEICLL